jgi:probable rRNA maturation factor
MKKPNKTKALQPASQNTKLADIKPTLNLSVQFAVPAERLTRQRIRSWVKRAADNAWQVYALEAQGLQLNLRFVDQAEGQALNTQFRHKPKATNVLTFAYGLQEDGMLTADVIICVPVLTQEASKQSKSFDHHAAHLIVHGTLHALGFDHIDDAQAQDMEDLEAMILGQMKISDPYVAST